MAMRLYLYGGRAATPAGPVVVLSHRREMRGTRITNVVTGEWRFATYEEASRFVTSSGRADVTIVSKHPHETCVPLEALSSYTPVFKALDRDGRRPDGSPGRAVVRVSAAPAGASEIEQKRPHQFATAFLSRNFVLVTRHSCS